jgi:pimeloyl-ACP methyl ester carboxylesterase
VRVGHKKATAQNEPVCGPRRLRRQVVLVHEVTRAHVPLGGSTSVPVMATFAVIHGGGGSAWDWHLVVPELRKRGHEPVAVDLPCDQESAGWWAYAGAVVDAVAERRDVIVVGHSLGGFTAPLVCARVPADLLILLCGMIPASGELFDDWWKNVGYEPSGFDDVFYHDVPPRLAAEAQRRERNA